MLKYMKKIIFLKRGYCNYFYLFKKINNLYFKVSINSHQTLINCCLC